MVPLGPVHRLLFLLRRRPPVPQRQVCGGERRALRQPGNGEGPIEEVQSGREMQGGEEEERGEVCGDCYQGTGCKVRLINGLKCRVDVANIL